MILLDMVPNPFSPCQVVILSFRILLKTPVLWEHSLATQQVPGMRMEPGLPTSPQDLRFIAVVWLFLGWQRRVESNKQKVESVAKALMP